MLDMSYNIKVMKHRYIVGIDLGTTNSAVGYVDLHDAAPGAISILTFKIPQVVGSGRVSQRPALPSFLYMPGEYELQAGSCTLPWAPDRKYVVGTYARDQGGLVPGKLVSSAKSWLCHGGVDREAPILPWGAGAEVDKISPVTASARYLQHIREAWKHLMDEPLEDQMVILTVPASFDEVARELTVRAAEEAGLPEVTLLEEPLAAFYAWLSHHEDEWNSHIRPGDLLLVCDVGGGTTDFTLIACEEAADTPRLERVAVGSHLLLGGDNMDLALAAAAEQSLGQKLDQAQWQALFHQCRKAKEILLDENSPERTAVRLAGRGRSMIGGTMVTDLERDRVIRLIVDGFYPEIELEKAEGAETGNTGLREMGLPYCNDPAVTRHLARFLLKHGGGRMPSMVLYNGGSLKSHLVRQRLDHVLAAWTGGTVRELDNRSLDLAISWGAAYYGLVRKGLGLSVGGGIARSYFIGISSGPTGSSRPEAVCLLERGTEEDMEVEILETFKVLTNRPVRFSLFSSTTRKGDRVGDIVPVDSGDLIKLPPLQTLLRYGKKGRNIRIPVRLGAKVTAVGTLEIYCESLESPHKWRLQFQLRGSKTGQTEQSSQVEGVRVVSRTAGPQKEKTGLSGDDVRAVESAGELIRRCFAPAEGDSPVAPSELPGRISECMGMDKDLWSLPVLRALADILLEVKAGRRKSPGHEARWYNLTGYCMRPGAGEMTDPWRIKTVWPLFFEGLSYARDKEPRLQWWIFWRRIAAGLGTGQQTQFYSAAAKALIPPGNVKGRRRKGRAKPLKVSREEKREIWLFAASLERLEIARKVELGRELVSGLISSKLWPGALWALARVGARELLYGPADKVVPPGEVYTWLVSLKKREWKHTRQIVETGISLARLTGDRTRDLTSDTRQDVQTWLQLLGADEKVLLSLKNVIPVAGREKNQAFGENLPEGLIFEKGGAE
ncbi:MAG TPA: molecular chaperone DnaK [Thermodesulfobacteriaceae bacterium]|nr:molecular chaperone DnaK [Thermodesulfobacteriaceae bacterium]